MRKKFIDELDLRCELIPLKKALKKQDAWQQVAIHFGLDPTYDLKEYSEWGLILALRARQITVENLCKSLLALDLQEALSFISLKEALRIVRQPYFEETIDCFLFEENIYVRDGGTLTLKIDSIGFPVPTYQWFRDNVPLSEEPKLVISSFSKEMEGIYRCVVQQIAGVGKEQLALQSNYVTVRLAFDDQAAPKINSRTPIPRTFEVEIGGSLEISVDITVCPDLKFHWWHDNERLTGFQSSILHIPSVDAKHGGEYTCRVINKNGESTIKFSCKVKERKSPSAKTALIIANSDYTSRKLGTPHYDAESLHQCLKRVNFKCTVVLNRTAKVMRDDIKAFCKNQQEGAYVLFYYGGHGLKEKHSLYMMGREADVFCPKEENVVNESFVIEEIQKTKPKLLITILDMCQASLSLGYLQQAHPLQQIEEHCSLIQCYATSQNRPAFEEKGKQNSVYMKHLQDVICNRKELTISEMFRIVNQKVREETCGQIPQIVDTMIRQDYKLSDEVL